MARAISQRELWIPLTAALALAALSTADDWIWARVFVRLRVLQTTTKPPSDELGDDGTFLRRRPTDTRADALGVLASKCRC